MVTYEIAIRKLANLYDFYQQEGGISICAFIIRTFLHRSTVLAYEHGLMIFYVACLQDNGNAMN